MKTIIHKADTRGHADHGWLNAHHSFSFAHYYDETRLHFGALRVLNDDIIAPGMGFGKHPHDNMEIITIPLRGALKHADSTGRGEVIKTGDVQIMSAGSGLQHSEVNASTTDDVNLLQIWVFPKLKNITPRYEQKTFDVSNRHNEWQTIVSPDKDIDKEAVWINQDAWFNMVNLDKGKEVSYTLHSNIHGVYIFIIEGGVEINSEKLDKRDGIGISDTKDITIKASADAQILLMEVPM